MFASSRRCERTGRGNVQLNRRGFLGALAATVGFTGVEQETGVLDMYYQGRTVGNAPKRILTPTWPEWRWRQRPDGSVVAEHWQHGKLVMVDPKGIPVINDITIPVWRHNNHND